MLKHFLVTVFFLGFAAIATAQTPDSLKRDTVKKETAVIKNVKDTLPRQPIAPPAKVKKEKTYHPDSTHIPSLAVKRSLFVPGWGQIYNRKIWKVPIIYGGLGSLALAVIFNQKNYTEFLALARLRQRGDPPKPGQAYYAEYIKYKDDYERYANVSYESLAAASDGYLRNRSLSILGIIGLWGLQAVDAYIDAKFINAYTVDDNLSFKVTPGFIGQPMYAGNFSNAVIPGIKITFTL